MEVNKNTSTPDVPMNLHVSPSNEAPTDTTSTTDAVVATSVESDLMTDQDVAPVAVDANASSSEAVDVLSSTADLPSSSSDSPITTLTQQVLSKSKLDVSQAALKQVSKLLLAISKKNDKKTRQLRSDNIIIKKYVHGVPHMLDLMKAIGFEESTIDNKPYLSIDESHDNIANMGALATELADAVPCAPKAVAAPATVASTVLCTRGCGFYGDPSKDNLCSKCYRIEYDRMLKPSKTDAKPVSSICSSAGCKNKCSPAPIDAPGATPGKPTGRCILCDAAVKHKSDRRTPHQRLRRALTKTRVVTLFNKCKRPTQTDKERCWTCRRKLHLSGVECRCGYIFCGKHRYAEEHECTFDHYKRHQQALAKQNQIIKHDKFDRLNDE